MSWRPASPTITGTNRRCSSIFSRQADSLLARDERAVFATLSARVGSISDNHLGGWYSYRAAKAALNQMVRTAAIELARTRPQAICVALHPGTVNTGLSGPFAKAGLEAQGGNMFLETAASGQATVASPGDPGLGTLMQGFVEASNVNPVSEITALITAQRAYEMNSRVVKTADEMLATTSQLR